MRRCRVAKLPWGQQLRPSPFFGNFGVAPPPPWGRLSSKEPRAPTGTFEFHIRRDLRLASPRAETASDRITMGFDEPFDKFGMTKLKATTFAIRGDGPTN